MKRYSCDRGNTSGGVGFFTWLLIVALVVKFFWWLVAAAAVVVLFFVGRVVVHHVRERKAAAAREAEKLAYRADRQHQWVRRGDSRGVYGVAGAELMRTISPEPAPVASDVPGEELKVAGLATTPDGVTKLLAEKTLCWPWAAFASVLVQRRAAVQSRLRDCRLGYSTPTGIRAYSGFDVGWFVTERMEELEQLATQLEGFVNAPTFMEVFGGEDETTADAEGIVHVANRLMDYHERFLDLAERCRDYQEPSEYTGLLRDVLQLMNIPLDSYRTFIDDFVDRIAELPELVRYGGRNVEADPVVLFIDLEGQLMERISKQLRVAAKS